MTTPISGASLGFNSYTNLEVEPTKRIDVSDNGLFSPLDCELTIKDFPLVVDSLKGIRFSNIYFLGVGLGLDVAVLGLNDPKGDAKFLNVVVKHWLSESDAVVEPLGPPTWRILVEQLNEIEEETLGHNLQEKLERGEIPPNFSPLDCELTIEDLPLVVGSLKCIKFSNIIDLGIELGLDSEVLKLNELSEGANFLNFVVERWLSKSDAGMGSLETPTWKTLVKQLNLIGEETLGHNLQEKLERGEILPNVSPLDYELTIKELPLIVERLKEILPENISYLGVGLGINLSVLNSSQADNNQLLCQVVQRWLSKNDEVMTLSGLPTWRRLIEQLNKVDENFIAHNLEEKLELREVPPKLPQRLVPKASNTRLTRNDFASVSKILMRLPIGDLSELLIALGVSFSTIDKLNKNRDYMVIRWIDATDGVLQYSKYPCYNVLSQALCQNGHWGLAEEIAKTYPAEQGLEEVELSLPQFNESCSSMVPDMPLSHAEQQKLDKMLDKNISKGDFVYGGIVYRFINKLTVASYMELCLYLGISQSRISRIESHHAILIKDFWLQGMDNAIRTTRSLRTLLNAFKSMNQNGIANDLKAYCIEQIRKGVTHDSVPTPSLMTPPLNFRS
ncbi:hypothetical protein D5R81_19150 [Parashewanella spongiae]|uniref:Death domain-containing protein n=1 Tax=Parashewanella spongiae TaxID=342950 RepID=A0A3A6TQ27_9GAMM|nr:hypothetical protein [Parashewanella spongiae]MCL1080157.1 hypothetical protein [Parashewanella spongiae]RJY02502.1 hypothetical protein D5R81_19150 [Parashewanella spongiae]